jgi:hypothetical protein
VATVEKRIQEIREEFGGEEHIQRMLAADDQFEEAALIFGETTRQFAVLIEDMFREHNFPAAQKVFEAVGNFAVGSWLAIDIMQSMSQVPPKGEMDGS